MKSIIIAFVAGYIIATCVQSKAAVSLRMDSRSELTQIKSKLSDRRATDEEVQRGLELLISLSGY